MGLSFKSIGKKATEILGGIERQINPFDGGATYKNRTPVKAAPVIAAKAGGIRPAPGRGPAQGPVRLGNLQVNNPRAVSRRAVNINAVDEPDVLNVNSVDRRSLASKIFDQANPLDNGRTFKNKKPTNARSIIEQARENAITNTIEKPVNFTKPVYDLGKALVGGAKDVAATPVELGRAGVAQATGNEAAKDAALTRGSAGRDFVVGLARSPFQGVYQMGSSVNPFGGDVFEREKTFKDGIGRLLLGSEAQPTMQKRYRDVAEEKGTAYAAGEATLNALMTAVGAKASVKAGKRVYRKAKDGPDMAPDYNVASPSDVPTKTVTVPPSVRKQQIEEKSLTQELASREKEEYEVLKMEEEVAAAHKMTDDEFAAFQKETREKYTQKGYKKFLNDTINVIYDPRNIEQRLENQELAYQKKTGQLEKGQHELLGEDSLTSLRGQILNTRHSAGVRDNTRYTVPSGNAYSINDLLKVYGKENGKKALEFQRYRMYKDELERIDKGYQNTINIDEASAKAYIDEYESTNKFAVEHNAALRQIAADNVRLRNENRIDAPELQEKLAEFEYYTPRRGISPEDLVEMRIQGGVRSGSKGTEMRSQNSGGAVESPLDLYRLDNANTQRSIAEAKYGRKLRELIEGGRMEGKELVSPEKAREHKQLQRRLQDLGEELKTAKRARDQIKRKSEKVPTASANRKAKAADDAVINTMREIIAKAKGKTDDVYNDLAERSPRHAKETAAIREKYRRSIAAAKTKGDHKAAQKLNTERRNALDAVNKKYPVPKGYTRAELMEIARAVYRSDERVANKVDVSRKKRGRAAEIQREAEDLRSMLENSRQNVKDVKGEASATHSDWLQSTQHTDRGSQVYSFKIDGEVGKLEIPNDLARSLEKQNEAQNRTGLETGVAALADAQKIAWTGILQPAFKIFNVAAKNPILMYRNADGVSGINHNSIQGLLGDIVREKGIQEFKNKIKLRGAAYENAMQSRNIGSSTSDDIAARANIKSFFSRKDVGIGDVWKGFNQAFAYFDNAQRTAVAYGAYKRAKALDWPEEKALQAAADAPARVFGDFDRVSRLAQNLELILPYAGATQAGIRAMSRATKTKPLETSFKDATLIAAVAATTGYSLSNTAEYHQDMIAAGREYELDANWTVVLPGAEKDKATGEWDGVIKIPLTPDFRALNRATWRSTMDFTNDSADKDTAKLIGYELFNMFTGDMATNIYDGKRVNEASNYSRANGVLTGSPVVAVGKVLGERNQYTGKPLADDYTANKARTEQYRDSTSKGAKAASKFTQGLLTPLQFDELFNRFGTAGDLAQQKEDGGSTLLTSVKKPLKPGVSMTEKQKSGRSYGQDIERVSKLAPNKETYDEFMSLNNKKTNPGLLNSADKAGSYLNNPDLIKMQRELNLRGKQRGQPSNPLWELPDDKLKKVLMYRDAKMLNAGKQNFDKNGNSLYTALGLDEGWYDEHREKETAFYDKLSEKTKSQLAVVEKSLKKNPNNKKLQKDVKDLRSQAAEAEDDEIKTFSGVTKPEATGALKEIDEAFHALPSGTGERSAYLKQHPELLAFWETKDEFTKTERDAIGLKNFDDEGGFGGSGGYSNYASGGYGGGRSGGRRRKSDDPNSQWSNPYEFAVSDGGGSLKKPKVTVSRKKRSGKRKVTAKKPTMKITRSKV